jgi:hypothetical protein
MDESTGRSPRKSLTKKQLEDPVALDLLALLQTVTSDGKLLEPEVLQLKQWLDDQKASSIPAIVHLRESVEAVLADGRVTDEERAWLQKAVETVLPREQRELAALRRREAVADKRRETAAEKERQAEIKRRSQPVAGFDFMVAGVHYEDRASIIKRFVKQGDTVFLAREPANQYSPNATVVRLQNGYEIGFVPETDAVYLASLLDKGALQSAEVKKVLHGSTVPIPVIWGELYEPAAPVPEAVKASQIPARQAWTPRSAAKPADKRTKTGCLVVLAALVGLALLL